MPDENTVSVTAGSTTVLGHLTQFVGFAGDTFNAGGLSVPVAAVVSTSELTLAYGWPGSDVIDSAAWVLMPTAPDWSSTVALHKAIVEANAWRNGKFPFPFNAGGPIAKRDLFDGEPTGFTFLELTGDQDDPFRLYGKMSDASGDWSVGQTLRGDAALGTQQAIDAAAMAQAWATQESGEVAPGEGYSAKYHAGRSEGAADDAVTAAGLSEGFAGDASTSAGQSAGFATNASTAAALAQAWATQESGEVEPGGGFSAKYHAGQSAGSAADSEEARDLARQWATKTDGEVVAGQGRGAKYYAEQAALEATGALKYSVAQTLSDAEAARGQVNLRIRERLYANRTYYVRSDGNDANAGRGTTAGLAFKTYQRAVREAMTLDFNGFDVTILAVDEGSQKIFTENVQIKPLVGGGSLHIRGAGSSKTRLTSATGNTFTQEVSGTTSVSYGAMELYATTGCGIKVNYLSLAGISDDMVFGSFGDSAIWVHDSQSIMQILNADIYIIGSMSSFLFIQYGHVFFEGSTINLVGSPVWSSGFITTWPRGTIQYIGNTLAGPATPNGPRRNINKLSVLNLNGSPTSVLPGSSDGTVDATSVQM